MDINTEWIRMIEEATNSLDNKIFSIVNETVANKDIKVTRFHKMVEEIEDYAIILLDREGNIENWNLGAEKMKGYKAIEIVGKNVSIFYSAEDLKNKRLQNLIKQASKNGSAKDVGWRVRKDESRFWASVVITAIHNNDGKVIGFTKVTRDLTEKKLAEEANKAYIIQLENQIKRLSA